MKKFDLTFQGFWHGLGNDKLNAGLPQEPGVYLAYACERDGPTGPLIPERLIQICDCSSLATAAAELQHDAELRRHLLPGEELGLSFARLLFGRKQAAAALIYQHKPIGNFQYKFYFPFEPTHVAVRGDTPRVKPGFQVPDPADRDVTYLFERFLNRKTA